jgi:hypothetical protein
VYIDSLGTAKSDTGSASLAKAFIHPGKCFYHFTIPIFDFFAFDSLVRANTLAKETTHALRVNWRSRTVYDSDQRITC